MSGVAGLGQLPAFELPAAGGGRVRSWDYKSRRHLVLWLAGPAPDRRALAAVAAREPEVHAEGAVLLVVLATPRERAEQIRSESGLRGPILADGDGRVHARLEAHEPTLVVADRNGGPSTGARRLRPAGRTSTRHSPGSSISTSWSQNAEPVCRPGQPSRPWADGTPVNRTALVAVAVREGVPYHAQIYAALRDRDPERARQAVEGHLLMAGRLYGSDLDQSLDRMARGELERFMGPSVSLERILDTVATS